MERLINQENNYAGAFGATYRSSAIFYKPKYVKTTIVLSNYWSFKNFISAGLVITTRTMKGKIIERKEVTFRKCNVLSLVIESIDEGSVEIEAFSNVNMRIPYAAVMAIYEATDSISMVHSYGRNHSLIELEDDNAIVAGRESCWTLRPRPNLRNLTVFHNGHLPIDSQTAKFCVTRLDGLEITVEFDMPPIDAFETYVFEAENIFPDLKVFLDGEIGWGTLHFEGSSSFTRLLAIWLSDDNSEVQVTHTNFDYTAHQTSLVETSKPAYMVLPKIGGELPHVLVYPKFSEGVYSLNKGTNFQTGQLIAPNEQRLEFRRTDGSLPARIVTALTGHGNVNEALPFECSLGVVHEKRPPKRFHWFVVSGHYPSTIHITAYEEIYAQEGPIDLVFRLYTEEDEDYVEEKLEVSSLRELPEEIMVGDLFDMSDVQGFAYASVFSHYGGLFIYSSLRKGKSVTLEHSF